MKNYKTKRTKLFSRSHCATIGNKYTKNWIKYRQIYYIGGETCNLPCNWNINFIHFFLQDATIHKKKKDFRHEVGNPYNESEYTLRKGCLLGRSMQQSSSHSRVQKYCYFKKLTIAYRQINRKLTIILSTNNIYSRYTNQCIIIVNHTLIVFIGILLPLRQIVARATHTMVLCATICRTN